MTNQTTQAVKKLETDFLTCKEERAIAEKYMRMQIALEQISTDLDFKAGEEWLHRLQRRMKMAESALEFDLLSSPS